MAQEFNNPFTPVVGKVPLYMAGREDIISDVEAALAGEGNDPAIISLLVGARGNGKTALLSYFADTAESSGWITARVTCVPGMLNDIIIRTQRAAKHLVDTTHARKVKGVSIANIASVELEDSFLELENWRSKMDDTLDALAEYATGVLVTIDEVSCSVQEMTTLVAAFQHFLDEGKKVALIMAGLPYEVTSLLSGKSTSFLRRAARYELQALSDYEVEEALLRTMKEGGKSFTPDALKIAVDAIKGFPFMLQLVGYRAWRISEGANIVDVESASAAVSIAQKELEQRVYDAVWFELSEADKLFLLAMSKDDGLTKQADLAGRLGKPSGHVSRYKKRLLQQGIIQERSKGILEFCLPGFKEYFLERSAEEQGL
jgi:uncharacterized membrane protein